MTIAFGGASPFGVGLTGVTSEIETGLLARTPAGVVAVTDPVEVPTGRPPVVAVTATVTDPFAGIVIVEGETESHGVEVVTVAVPLVPVTDCATTPRAEGVLFDGHFTGLPFASPQKVTNVVIDVGLPGLNGVTRSSVVVLSFGFGSTTTLTVRENGESEALQSTIARTR